MAEPSSTEPAWVGWARHLAAIAQNGLEFSTDGYDRERYREVRDIAAAILAAGSDAAPSKVLEGLEAERGYATPKVDVRAVCFDRHSSPSPRVLLVREVTDGRWTLPGGWADPTDLPSAAVERETAEEAGHVVRATRLLACWDRSRQAGAPPYPFRVYKLFFACDVVGTTAPSAAEISGVGWFPTADLPNLSLGRTTAPQIARLLELCRDPALPADFH